MFNKQTQRCLSFLLALVMVFSLMPVSALATEDPAAIPADSTETSEITATGTEQEAPIKTEEVIPDESPKIDSSGEMDGTSLESSEPSTDPEATVTAEEIQVRIDAILFSFGITPEMTDDEIAKAIIAADGETIQNAMSKRVAIDEDAMLLSQEQFLMLELDLYERFWNTADLIFTAIPAVTVTGVSGVEVTCDSNGTVEESNGTVTVKAAGSFTTRKKTVITITNTSGSMATISFDISLSTYDSGESTLDDLGGSYSGTLAAGATQTFTFCSSRGSFTNNTGVATLSNFSVVKASTAYDVTLSYDTANGSVSIDGTAAVPGTHQIASAAFKATASSGASFLGWIDPATGAVISTDSTYNVVATATMNLEAVFAGSDTAWFYGSDKAYLFDSLTEANSHASSALNKTIVLANNGILSGSHTISSGVTLLIPYDSANTLCTTAPTVTDDTYVAPTIYRMLTMADGSNIIVNGAISVAGSQNATCYKNGQPHGPVGVIKMESGSDITVNNGGALYAWGYVAGSGTVTVQSGGTVYEDFQVRDYRGGNVTSTLAETSSSNVTTWHIFPMSQYYVQNVQVPMTMYAGAIEKGYFSVTASLMGIKTETVDFIGSNSMFQITSGYIVKNYDEATDRLVIDVYGNLEVNPFSVDIQVEAFSSSITINSANYDLPLTSNLTINLYGTSQVDLNQSILMLPGSVINIGTNAVLNVNSGKRLIVYDYAQWGKYCTDKSAELISLDYVYTSSAIAKPTKTRTTADLVDAQIIVNGTLNASGGYLYTTDGGGNICSSATGSVTLQNTPEATAYQIEQRRNGNDDFDSSTELDSHTITSAQLKNADGTYTSTTANNYYYCSTCGTWAEGSEDNCKCESHTCADSDKNHICDNGCDVYQGTHADSATDNDHVCDYGCGEVLESCSDVNTDADHNCDICGEENVSNHSYTAVTTAPTCTAQGYTTYTCACGESYVADEVAAVGHSYTSEVTQAATCTEAGVMTFTCGTCGDSYTEEIPATGHNYETVVTQPTCTEQGYTTYTCACGHSYEGDTVAATGHTEVIDAEVAATCTTTGLAEGKHCSVCGEVLVAQEEVAALGHSYEAVVTAPTCTAKGYTTYTCSVCGDSYVADEAEMVAHTSAAAVEENRVESTCTVAGAYDEVVYCSKCGEELSRETKALELAAHTEGAVVVENEVAATCTAEGSYDNVVYCTVCNTELSRNTVTVDKIAHAYEAVVTAPTCTEAGYTTYTCSACGDTYTADEVNALGHTPAAAVEENRVGSTCTVAGSYESVVYCSVCGEELSRETKALELAAHTEGAVVVDNEVAATCTAEGSYDNVVYCTVCNAELSRNTVTVEKIDHDYEAVMTAPTCTEKGYTTYTCSACGDSYVADEVAALGHSYSSEVTTPATCTEAGVKTYTCGTCGDSYTEEIPATGHENTTTTTVDATCVDAGSVTVTCNDCGTTISTETIAATGHNYVDGVCTGCGAEEPVVATIVDRGNSLILEGMVHVKQYIAFENIEMTEAEILANAGIEIITETGTTYTVGLTHSGMYQGYDEYYAQTNGIPAKELGDTMIFRIFIIVDGEKIYFEKEYSPLIYADRVFTLTSDEPLKNLLVAMLNYGAAAQLDLIYKTDELMNANLQTYVDNGYVKAEYLEMDWKDEYLTAAVEPDESLTGNFATTNTISNNGMSLLLEGAISIKYYKGIGNDSSAFNNASEKIMYFWTEADYKNLAAAGIPLTKDNASYSVDAGVLSYGGAKYGYEYSIVSEQYYAKNLGDTLYSVLCITDANGTEHCSGVEVFSPEVFASKAIVGSDLELVEVAKWMVVYGERAKIYFTS